MYFSRYFRGLAFSGFSDGCQAPNKFFVAFMLLRIVPFKDVQSLKA